MNNMELLFLVLYAVFMAFAWPVMGCWLYDTGKFGGSRSCAVVVGLALAFVWPFSLVAVHFSKSQRPAEGAPGGPAV